ncbi:uncharacterized protein LOC129719171 [Wyeomyia smithii]|uniref:uncharacterized protein LOC129719171 n=1 Tax=Wyeomyia smithii TaxID=174621 RepID=UPI002467B1A2|nr:uncharacterized protein LOC129719171 [Wyeomyia smithii]
MDLLLEGKKPDGKMLSQITHVLCDCLLAVYGERPSTDHKEMIAKSLVKTYPILGSTVSEQPYALWFHRHGRGSGRHAGKIHYRMERLAKLSSTRVFHRHRNKDGLQELYEIEHLDEDVEVNIDDLVKELKFSVPTDQTKGYIISLWRRTAKFRQDLRKEGTLLMFMTDFPVASAFCGLLISEDYQLMKPGASAFVETWDSLQLRVLERHHEMFRYIKNNFIRAVAIIRVKNPTRGSKRLRDQNEEDFLKTNPLHGVVQWIEDGQTMPVPEIPQVIIVGPEFHDGDCSVVWKDIVIPTGADILTAFDILCKAFTVFNVKCAASDKLFYSFFAAACYKVEHLSTTAAKFINLL